MAKIKVSHTIDEELVAWLNSEIETKRFASISHGIEYALTVLKGTHTQPQTTTPDPEIIIELSLSLEAMRQKWWDDKQIGISIAKAGGIGIINLKNIIQKNPDLFETKEECRVWLYNKLKTDPPIIEEIETPKPHKISPRTPVTNLDPTTPPKFTPNRSTIKCPDCGEEQLEIPGSLVKKCVNCGHTKPEDNTISLSDQSAPAQDVSPSPPTEA